MSQRQRRSNSSRSFLLSLTPSPGPHHQGSPRHHSPLAEVGAERGQEAGQAEAELVGGAERQSDHHRDQRQVHQQWGPLAWAGDQALLFVPARQEQRGFTSVTAECARYHQACAASVLFSSDYID